MSEPFTSEWRPVNEPRLQFVSREPVRVQSSERKQLRSEDKFPGAEGKGFRKRRESSPVQESRSSSCKRLGALACVADRFSSQSRIGAGEPGVALLE